MSFIKGGMSIVLSFGLSSAFASPCPDWIVPSAGFDVAKSECKVVTPEEGLSMGQAVIYGEALEGNSEKLAGVSLGLVEWKSASKQFRMLDRISGIGESRLEMRVEKEKHFFYEVLAQKTSYYLLRAHSDKVALMLAVVIDKGRLKILPVKEQGGLLRDALVGNIKGTPEIFSNEKYPLYVRLPVESGYRTYFLVGKQFVSR